MKLTIEIPDDAPIVGEDGKLAFTTHLSGDGRTQYVNHTLESLTQEISDLVRRELNKRIGGNHGPPMAQDVMEEEPTP